MPSPLCSRRAQRSAVLLFLIYIVFLVYRSHSGPDGALSLTEAGRPEEDNAADAQAEDACVHFITFSDRGFGVARDQLVATAERSGAFCSVKGYSVETIPADLIRDHGEFIRSQRRGCGYWIWKPYILLDVWKRAKDGDVIVYADAGCTLNLQGMARFNEYVDMVVAKPDGLLAMRLPNHKQKVWTKGDTLQRLNCGDACRNENQIIGTYFMMRKSAKNRKLIQEWLDIATEDNYRYLADAPSQAPNDPAYSDHRHDQSIWSLLVYARDDAIVLWPDETHEAMKGRFGSPESLKYPFWASRARGGGDGKTCSEL